MHLRASYALLAFFAAVLLINAADIDYRLKPYVVPDLYAISIKPYLLPEDGDRRFTFDGEVNITLHAILAGTREIQLHTDYDYITIAGAWLFDRDDQLLQTITDTQMKYVAETDLLTLSLNFQMTLMVNYTLRFVYQGQIRDGMAGFFRVNYTDVNGDEKWMGVTQSQRIDARTIFPCFDEPAFKAKFRLDISRPVNYTSYFNTRLISSEPDGENRIWDHFEETPLMSTYLVAFIVAEYDVRHNDDDLYIVTRPEYINKTDFAFNVAERALEAYNNYTKLPYKELGNTIMQAATSSKFPHNGMENWGLIIYSDSVLVHEPNYTDGWANKEFTITILVHETAHMWFGDSVTFSWWSYFWLNEGFARYYQYFLAHTLYPEYQLDQQFVVKQVQLIFGIDALNSTQPMTSPEDSIQSPAEVASKFSSIAYAKGASIIRMIRNIMGYDQFDNAIREYLKVNHLRNTIPLDLFNYLKQYWPTPHQVDLDTFFSDWTEQVGFPVLNVTVASDGRSIHLHQERFLLDPDDGSDATLTYTIPITYTTNNEANFDDLTPKFYLNKTVDYDFQLDKSVNWIIFNLQQSNYYRVCYDVKTYQNIRQALRSSQHSGVPATNRAQLIDDLFNFARVGMRDYTDALDFIEYMSEEVDYIPWYAAFAGLQRVAQRLTIDQLPQFREFLFDITEKVYEKLGFHNDNDSVLDVYNRNMVIAWLCKYQKPGCADKAKDIMQEVESTGVKPSPDFRETLYCAATRMGEYKFYRLLESWFNAENVTSERAMLVRAMGCTRYFMDTHYLGLLVGVIPPEYAEDAITPMYKENPENVTPAFERITETIDKLAAIVGWSKAADIVADNANYFTTSAQKALLEKFIEEKGELFGAAVTKLENAVKLVDTNLNWAEVRLKYLDLYFEQRNSASLNGCATLLFLLMAVFYTLLH